MFSSVFLQGLGKVCVIKMQEPRFRFCTGILLKGDKSLVERYPSKRAKTTINGVSLYSDITPVISYCLFSADSDIQMPAANIGVLCSFWQSKGKSRRTTNITIQYNKLYFLR